MGFLRFLSKGKSKVKDELDIPPLPPPGASESLGSIEEELPPLPELKGGPETGALLKFPGFSGEEQEPIGEELPPLPEEPAELELSEMEPIGGETGLEGIPIVPLTKPYIKEPVQGAEKIKRTKPLFIGMDSFKNDVLKNIASIKNELKSSNGLLSKLAKLEQDENILFKDWHDKMGGLQRNLMSVDKVLFKG